MELEGTDSLKICRRELFDYLRSTGPLQPTAKRSRVVLVEYIMQKYNIGESVRTKPELERIVNSFTVSLNRLWKGCHRKCLQFLKKNKSWIDSEITIPFSLIMNLPGPSHISTTEPERPQKMFSTVTKRSKLRKVKKFVHDTSLEEISFATEVKLRKSGKRDAAELLKGLTSSPKRATRMKRLYNKSNVKQTHCYSPDEALALMTSTKLTKAQYNAIRKSSIEKEVKLYPSYYAVKQAKTSCYRSDNDLIVTESVAEINMQALTDLTIKRLIDTLTDVMDRFICEGVCKLKDITMTFKWGCDGSGGQNRYKQEFCEENFEDANVMATSLVPLQLVGTDNNNKKIIIWNNPRPSSTRYCRPIRYRFVKETDKEGVDEFNYIRSQIVSMTKTKIEFKEISTEISHEFLETMVDGKICNALAFNKSTQRCYICGKTPKDMNNLGLVRPCNKQNFSWGLSILHAYIRFMECILHISYKLDIKKWQARGRDQEIVAQKKQKIISEFRKNTGLLLDTPKQGGGNTNDGNSARRFFQNASVTSQITGIDLTLIERFSLILSALSSGFDLNIDEFEKYCNETANLYVSLYDWYPMPVTVHKILMYGPTYIIKQFLIPIGQLSEEVQESRHKEFRKFREGFSRKTSRIDTNIDILHHLLISSDPVIVSLLTPYHKKRKSLTPELLKLLKAPEVEITSEENDDSDFDSDQN